MVNDHFYCKKFNSAYVIAPPPYKNFESGVNAPFITIKIRD